jgi:hypothetical protein
VCYIVQHRLCVQVHAHRGVKGDVWQEVIHANQGLLVGEKGVRVEGCIRSTSLQQTCLWENAHALATSMVIQSGNDTAAVPLLRLLLTTFERHQQHLLGFKGYIFYGLGY